MNRRRYARLARVASPVPGVSGGAGVPGSSNDTGTQGREPVFDYWKDRPQTASVASPGLVEADRRAVEGHRAPAAPLDIEHVVDPDGAYR